MSAAGSSPAGPFSPRGVLLLVLFGAAVLIALFWMIGAGMTQGSTNDGGGHAGGKGLNGYAALAGFLESRGMTVRRSQSEAALDDRGLLVLTPPQWADGETLEGIVSARRYVGPTLIILPKWLAGPAPAQAKGAKKGWVMLAGTAPPSWDGFYDDIEVAIEAGKKGAGRGWQAEGVAGALPDGRAMLWGGGRTLVPLATAAPNGRFLAAYVDDGGTYARLRDMAVGLGPGRDNAPDGDEDLFPVVMVFEPDLLDNYGMKDLAAARFADRLFAASSEGADRIVIFDLTLNGFARSANLLTLAFTPPFLAATLCLLMAALVVGWRAFARFGPARRARREIAFGKRQLVSNAAGLVRRTRRYHLVSRPYLDRLRARIVRALALPRQADSNATDAAIDRAVAARLPGETSFSQAAARLLAARKSHDLLGAARALHSLERKLTR